MHSGYINTYMFIVVCTADNGTASYYSSSAKFTSAFCGLALGIRSCGKCDPQFYMNDSHHTFIMNQHSNTFNIESKQH